MWLFGDSHVTAVAVMDPAHLWMRDYVTQFGRLNRTAIRGVAMQRAMGSRSVVVRYVAPKHPQEMSFVEDDDVVEALPTDGADQTLAVGVLPGRSRCRQRSCAMIKRT